MGASPFVIGLLGQRLGVDIHHRGPNLPGDLHKLVGRDAGIDNLEGSGVSACVLLFLPTDAVSRNGAADNGSG